MREREREWLKYRNVKVDFQLLAEKKEIQFLFKQKSQKKKSLLNISAKTYLLLAIKGKWKSVYC